MSKPLFTTTEPGFMGMVGDLSHADEYNTGNVSAPDDIRVYIDGDLERRAGYDIPVILDGEMTGEDKQECQFLFLDGQIIDAVINLQSDSSESDYPLYYIQLPD